MQSANVPQASMQSPRSRIYDISTRQLKNFLPETKFSTDDVNAGIGNMEMKDIEKSAISCFKAWFIVGAFRFQKWFYIDVCFELSV